jgi:hypothetical protein
MVKKIIEGNNKNGEPRRVKVYDGNSVKVSSVVGECEVKILDKSSSEEIKISGTGAIGELFEALSEICSDKAIKKN